MGAPARWSRLARAMVGVLRDGQHSRQMAERALADVKERFSSAGQLRAHERVYDEAVRAPGTEPAVAASVASSKGGAE